ncbi:MAG: serine/threonine protein kinase [Sandaracinaceae bacterium]|nr:serine/threonine protein kinase [Sandaracinaceae bacterium]
MGSAQSARRSLPPAGARVAGRYLLVRKLAEGGMGAVYEAEDPSGARVALKLLHPDLTSDADVRRRFRRESSILRALDHPAIVRILDAGEEQGVLLFMVMELLEGETLAQRLEREGKLDAQSLLPIVRGVCAGLREAHGRGVIHGDLKPANVFLCRDGPKLLDFGLSKVLGLERLTRTGEVIGTPAYMAPELLTGKGQLDERIDVYSLGVILYQALAGRPPFVGNVPGKLMMDIVMGDAPALRSLCDASEATASVIACAMSRAREARFANASELVNALEASLA